MSQQQRFKTLLDSGLIGPKGSIQYIQTLHRRDLIEFWSIMEGQTILEIGCGQGDTTAVLSSYVGGKGKVIAVDRNPIDYGAPLTLGEATRKIKRTELGNSILFHFDVDLLTDDLSFLNGYKIDAVVISHSSWYFDSEDVLTELISKLQTPTNKLLFAEWHMQIRTLNQVPHWISAVLQAEYHILVPSNQHNIRTIYNEERMIEIIANAGGTIEKKAVIINEDLQDGLWEVEFLIRQFPWIIERYSVVSREQKQLWLTQLKTVQHLKSQYAIKPLDIFVFVATI